MSFEITIDQFEGPLDLMLHLIKQNKLDLFDLNIDILTIQYLQYLNSMESLQLEIASEYLLELANLLEYKSKKLLPQEKVEIEEIYEEDQREILVARLLEYQRFKEISEELQKKYETRQMHWEKPLSEEVNQWVQEEIEKPMQGSPYDLMKAMNKVLRRKALYQPLKTKLTIKELSVDERMLQLRNYMNKSIGKHSFTELCNDCDDIHTIIVTFLAILDMIHHQEVLFHIDDQEEIWLIRSDINAINE